MATWLRPWATALAIALSLIGVAPAAPAAVPPQERIDPWSQCERAIARQERLQALPERLLHAISMAESGRWNGDQQRVVPWPWTVMAEGRGRYLENKEAAINEVLMLRRKGVRNIDVGCMQVNLQYHPDAFDNLNEAFDPDMNARYAADFLRRLQADSGSWTTAVGHYHSQAPERTYPYRRKVLQIWRDIQRQGPPEPQLASTAPKAGFALADGRRPLTPEEVTRMRQERLVEARSSFEARRDRVKATVEARRRAHEAFIQRQTQLIAAYRRGSIDSSRRP